MLMKGAPNTKTKKQSGKIKRFYKSTNGNGVSAICVDMLPAS